MKKINYIGYRPTWAQINLGNLSHNLYQIKKLLAPSTKIMVTVKADAYGHGLIPVSKRLVSSGVDFLGAASIDEGIKLREAGINLPVLIMGLALKQDLAPIISYGLTATVCDEDLATALNKKARALGRRANVHIKVDTGMGRIGVLPQDAEELVKNINKLKYLRIEGLFTHFAVADRSKKFTFHQLDLFNRLISKLKKSGINIPLTHAANSIGIIDYKNSHLNMVRPGLVIYGLYPAENFPAKAGSRNMREKIKLRPVLSLKTKVVFVKRLPKGSGISYGHDYVTKKDTKVATLPIGYGDGYPRSLSNHAPVLIRNKRFKISGRICMDQVMVDIGSFSVKVGDEVVLIGEQGNNKITVEELAGLCATIPYEIVCGLGSRIPRLYI